VKAPPRYDVPKKAPGSLRIVQEFLNTADREHGREWLDSPAALRRWLRERGLGAVRVDGEDVTRAQELRESLREFVGGTDTRAAERLNRVAREAGISLRFYANATELVAGAPGVAGALGRILLAVFEAMTEGSWPRLKTCPNCHWSFYDYSRNRSARWCSMTLCGNRSKTHAYYHRHSRV
jgi:predicted RNA-binding Zn ribbon-like protein